MAVPPPSLPPGLWVDYALEGLVLAEKVWFLRLFHTESSWHAYCFSAVIVSGRRDLQEHSLWLKKLISQVPEDAMLKIRRPVYRWLFKSTRVLRADRKRRCKSNLSTVSVLANRGLHQDVMHSRCRGTTASDVCLQALTLSLPSPRDFFTLAPNRAPVHKQ